jgi:hypothetical protein
MPHSLDAPSEVQVVGSSLKLPPLLVPIYRGEALESVAGLADPREAFINCFNAAAEEHGLRAELY